MGLIVTDQNDAQHKFDEANVWHVDEEGSLHISRPNRNKIKQHPPAKNIPDATFAPGRWICVAAISNRSAGPFHEQED